MYPGNKFDGNLLTKIIENAYWSVFGELTVLGKIQDCTDVQDCPENVTYNYFLFMIYMAFANILLLNLLIAMLRYFV